MDMAAMTMPPRPFTTDGCSGGLSQAWRALFRQDPPWEGACIEHDRAYWKGGTILDRVYADRRLYEHVRLAGYPATATLVWIAVRAGGHPLWPFPWRWGYCWPWPRGYTN